MNQTLPKQAGHPVTLEVPDLTEALDFFTQRLGFRLDMILPADAPASALVSGQGIALSLNTKFPSAGIATADAAGFVISRQQESGAWHTGRAGMQYRDLIPGRMGGRFVASHIRIPEGGPIPDYVHYHKVRFQMIYCKTGWVRLVYENQGPPFVMQAGDCVLQPPEIRHRVLESSAGLEVIEIGAPAIHETWVEHELLLPTPHVMPGQLFGGQYFVRHQAAVAPWQPARLSGFTERDTGIGTATQGLAGARVLRAEVACHSATLQPQGELQFWFVLAGEISLASATLGTTQLQAGDSCVIPAGAKVAVQAATPVELLEVTLPA